MKVTQDALASRLRDYLQHRITHAALVDWAEHAMMDEEFDDRDFETVREITGRLGLADVREFGLTWEDCEGYPHRREEGCARSSRQIAENGTRRAPALALKVVTFVKALRSTTVQSSPEGLARFLDVQWRQA